jgi:hypothetical protein
MDAEKPNWPPPEVPFSVGVRGSADAWRGSDNAMSKAQQIVVKRIIGGIL